MIVLSDVAYVLRTFLLPILIVLGFLLNMISFFVMKQIRGSITANYMSFLALIDSAVLLVGGVNLWLHSINSNSLPIMSHLGCKLVSFLFYSFADYSVIIIVIMTGERLYGVWRPVHANKMLKNRLFRTNVTLTGLFCFLINSHFIFTHSLVIHYPESSMNAEANMSTTMSEVNKLEICEYVMWKEFYEKYWVFIDASVYSFLPFILITVFNIFIIRTLNKAEKLNKMLNEKHICESNQLRRNFCRRPVKDYQDTNELIPSRRFYSKNNYHSSSDYRQKSLVNIK